MVLSRIDSSCTVVVLGSHKQIANYYVNGDAPAVTTPLRSAKDADNRVTIFAIKLEKVVRGPITEWAA
ncbi:phosphate starvation-inducible protein PhoH, partial [Aliarcobacter butzleri]